MSRSMTWALVSILFGLVATLAWAFDGPNARFGHIRLVDNTYSCDFESPLVQMQLTDLIYSVESGDAEPLRVLMTDQHPLFTERVAGAFPVLEFSLEGSGGVWFLPVFDDLVFRHIDGEVVAYHYPERLKVICL